MGNERVLESVTVCSSPTNSKEEEILQALLANGAYIALASNNPMIALNYAKELLGKQEVNPNYK